MARGRVWSKEQRNAGQTDAAEKGTETRPEPEQTGARGQGRKGMKGPRVQARSGTEQNRDKGPWNPCKLARASGPGLGQTEL